MAIISEISEAVKGMKDISRNNYAFTKLAVVIRFASVGLIFFYFFLQYWNILEGTIWGKIPLWNNAFCNYLKNNTFKYIIA